MRKMGAAGAGVGAVSIAGCSGGGEDGEGGGGGGDGTDGGGGDTDSQQGQSDLPEERQIETLAHVSNTERYYAARYQANRLVDKRLREDLGIPAETQPVEITVLSSREEEGDYDLVTYNWCANNGDPDGIIVERFHENGSMNYTEFNHDRYNEVAMSQRTAIDDEERQELVYEAQKILGEQRPENQYLYNVTPYAFNNQAINPDSVVVNVSGLRNIWNYTQMEPTNENGRTIVTNNWDPSDQLNPLHINGVGPSRNWTPTRFMHDFLFRPDPNQQMVPWAASEYEWADDTTLDVTLKEGMTFHDGEAVTADDVVYTFNLIMDTEPPAYVNNVVGTTESVEKTGDLGVRFNLTEVYAPYIAITLGVVPILPQHYWEQMLADTGNEEQPWQVNINNDNKIIGSGPFMWGSWDQGSRFEMPAFKDHAFAAPNIDTRIQRPLSTRDAEMEAMINGEYILLDYWFGSPAELEKTVENNDHLSLVQNSDDCRQATWVNTARPPFDDVAFRQATNALIHSLQPTIIEELYDGFGNRAPSPINSTLKFWHNPDTPYFEDGAEGARTILQDAGYAWDQDGNIYYPEGKTGN
jgi:peptide/nickel transport system substrate-binding protein